MQRYQRIRHRMLWVVVAGLGAIALFVALTNQPEMPTQNSPVTPVSQP